MKAQKEVTQLFIRPIVGKELAFLRKQLGLLTIKPKTV